MKTIFRYTNIGLLVAAIMAFGAVAGSAQNPCEDAQGLTTLNDSVREKYNVKTIEGRKAFVEVGKQFVEKYGACEAGKDLGDWLKGQIPANEKRIKEMEIQKRKDDLAGRFDAGLRSKNWDAVYAAGKEILAEFPDDLRTAEIVLGSIGGEEAFKGNFKYADDTVRFARQSIADLDAGKSFVLGKDTRYGLSLKDSYNFEYRSKDEAIGWLNLYIGYIQYAGKKDKAGALPYLYKSTQAASDASKQSVQYELIGGYYFDQLNQLVEQIQKKAAEQKDDDTPEAAQQKVDDLKKLVAMSNGTAERAMDAFSRAYANAKDAAIKARMKKNVQDAYKLRFAKEDGVDAWIAVAVTKPFVNPQTPIDPISDPEPAKTDAGSSGATPTTAAPIKPAAKTAPGGVKPGSGS